jgi:hypothetical protein
MESRDHRRTYTRHFTELEKKLIQKALYLIGGHLTNLVEEADIPSCTKGFTCPAQENDPEVFLFAKFSEARVQVIDQCAVQDIHHIRPIQPHMDDVFVGTINRDDVTHLPTSFIPSDRSLGMK